LDNNPTSYDTLLLARESFTSRKKYEWDIVPVVVGGLLATPLFHNLCHL
jgi:hypothetical protein